jgi:hypothetical protein
MALSQVGSPLLDEVLEFLSGAPSPDEIVAFRPSAAMQTRVSELLDKNQAGTLSADEVVELDEYERLNHFMRLLKARTRQKMVS